jgi:hypothetical protein
MKYLMGSTNWANILHMVSKLIEINCALGIAITFHQVKCVKGTAGNYKLVIYHLKIAHTTDALSPKVNRGISDIPPRHVLLKLVRYKEHCRPDRC